jgi:hypothetical protein
MMLKWLIGAAVGRLRESTNSASEPNSLDYAPELSVAASNTNW